MSGFAPAGTEPALVLPAALAEAAELVRPVLVAGGEPAAVVILVDIDAQGVGD